MPPRYNMGLSDFGLSAPSVSSNADDPAATTDYLKQMLGTNEVYDAQSQANMLDDYLKNLNETKTPGTLDKLKSPQGLIALLLTGAAGALGGPAAAAGAGLGALTGAQAASEADATAKRNAQVEAQKQRDDALNRLDKSHQRFTSLLQSQPELFLDANGNQTIPPDVLGFYATGTPTPIFASTKRALEQRDASWAARNNLLTQSLKDSKSVDDAHKIVDAFFTNMGYQAPPEVSDAIARSAGTKEFTPEVMNTFFRFCGETALDATIQAKENGWGPDDPRFLSLLQFRDPDQSTNKVTPSDRALQLSQEINAWQRDPANMDTLRAIAQQSKTAEEKSMKIAQEVLGGREGDLRTYLHEMSLHDPSDWAMLNANFNAMQSKFKLGTGLSGIDQLPMFRNMSNDEQTQWMWQQAQHATDQQKQAQTDEQAKQDTAAVNGVAERLGKELNLAPDLAGEASASIAKLALQNSTRPDGRVDRVRFAQELKKLTDQAIAEAGK